VPYLCVHHCVAACVLVRHRGCVTEVSGKCTVPVCGERWYVLCFVPWVLLDAYVCCVNAYDSSIIATGSVAFI